MRRIVVVAAPPLHAEGVAAALRSGAAATEWDVHVGRADDEADAWVLSGDELQVRGRAGALAQLASGSGAARLRAAVAAVLEGLSVREAPWSFADAAAAGDHEPLTPRELEVFELLGKGLSNRDIGAVLEISAHTAKYHVGQILAKTGASTRAEAVREGLRCGLIGL
jgi:DNA-binding CsgD family transcriptional regulator